VRALRGGLGEAEYERAFVKKARVPTGGYGDHLTNQ
jgi:hypothetical protein